MQFEFDPDKARSNLRKHGVSFARAEQALRDNMAVTVEAFCNARDECSWATARRYPHSARRANAPHLGS